MKEDLEFMQFKKKKSLERKKSSKKKVVNLKKSTSNIRPSVSGVSPHKQHSIISDDYSPVIM